VTWEDAAKPEAQGTKIDLPNAVHVTLTKPVGSMRPTEKYLQEFVCAPSRGNRNDPERIVKKIPLPKEIFNY
jgi:hypothetical protein